MITDDEVLALLERADPARREPSAVPVDAAEYLESVRTRDGGDVIVVDLDAPAHESSPRRWVAVAAAAAALVLLVSGVLVWSATDDDDAPATPPAAVTTTATTTPTPAPVLSRDGEAPSMPLSGELVAAIFIYHWTTYSPNTDFALQVYADGRVLTGDASERRLTADGVARVREELLATGLFDGTAPPPGDTGIYEGTGMASDPAHPYSCACTIEVRDGGQLLQWQVETFSNPDLDRTLLGLFGFLMDLEDALPASAWLDRERRPFVPASYQVGVSTYPTDEGTEEAVPDLPALLAQHLPPPLVERLDSLGWTHAPLGDSVVVTLEDARDIVAAISEAPAPGALYVEFRLSDATPGSKPAIMRLMPILPDGKAPLS